MCLNCLPSAVLLRNWGGWLWGQEGTDRAQLFEEGATFHTAIML